MAVLGSQLNEVMKIQQQQTSSMSLYPTQLAHPQLPPKPSYSPARSSKEKNAAQHQEFIASLGTGKVPLFFCFLIVLWIEGQFIQVRKKVLF